MTINSGNANLCKGSLISVSIVYNIVFDKTDLTRKNFTKLVYNDV